MYDIKNGGWNLTKTFIVGLPLDEGGHREAEVVEDQIRFVPTLISKMKCRAAVRRSVGYGITIGAPAHGEGLDAAMVECSRSPDHSGASALALFPRRPRLGGASSGVVRMLSIGLVKLPSVRSYHPSLLNDNRIPAAKVHR
ncbi:MULTISPECIES: hypothetical protein [Bradyrhizobium]|uniref:hypothetical protein n=1 Tax=Bradyrhizobium elkanii TaxID=29448 RepID=UPI000418D0C7|nr:hypothetical protein [Bradyrhizobium elkanii]